MDGDWQFDYFWQAWNKIISHETTRAMISPTISVIRLSREQFECDMLIKSAENW